MDIMVMVQRLTRKTVIVWVLLRLEKHKIAPRQTGPYVAAECIPVIKLTRNCFNYSTRSLNFLNQSSSRNKTIRLLEDLPKMRIHSTFQRVPSPKISNRKMLI